MLTGLSLVLPCELRGIYSVLLSAIWDSSQASILDCASGTGKDSDQQEGDALPERISDRLVEKQTRGGGQVDATLWRKSTTTTK